MAKSFVLVPEEMYSGMLAVADTKDIDAQVRNTHADMESILSDKKT